MASKTYLRYVQQDVFGLIANSVCADVVYLPGQNGRVVAVPCLEDVSIWNLKQGLLLDVLRDPANSAVVTALALDPQERHLAVGYDDGKIRVWDLKSREVAVSLNAHAAAVTALAYNDTGALLASGARDTDIVLWDVVAEQGVCRLKGHKDEVTDLRFVDVVVTVVSDAAYTGPTTAPAAGAAAVSTRELSLLVSSSKDSFLKLWDTALQHCVHTLTGHRAEVWSFDLAGRPCDPYALLVAGSADKTLRSWKVFTSLFAPASAPSDELSSLFERLGVEYAGSVDRPGGKKRVRRVRFDRPAAAAVARAKAAALLSSPAAAAAAAAAAGSGQNEHVFAPNLPRAARALPDGRLPDAAQGARHVRDIFYRMGFDDREITALIGAHAMGKTHVANSGYEGPWTRAPTTFSNQFFVLLKEEKWAVRDWKGPKQYENGAKDLMMLPADMVFLWDPEFKKYTDLYAKDEEAFFKDFAKAYGKLLELGVPAFQNNKK